MKWVFLKIFSPENRIQTIMCTSLIGAGAVPALLAWAGENYSFPLAFACFGVLVLAGGVWALSRLRIPE